MQAADDERRDLERILSARPRDDGANQDERSAALRRLGELDAEDVPPGVTPPAARPDQQAPRAQHPRHRLTLVEGWELTTDVPPCLALLARDAVVYGSGFDTAENDRLLIMEPNGTTVRLAVQRPDASFFAGCTGSERSSPGSPSGSAARPCAAPPRVHANPAPPQRDDRGRAPGRPAVL
ncbi:hypothetical protein C5E02_13530 [Rathayibacter rathayi]|uniref:Uncharacterized protein n=1 Tax=Rathayibacter rathayi TaxID=33887 RepID=A0ABD6W9G3_RATRA|nr:hypothetical protein [Rathayibacter rathayi]AZZ50134.1 hypothetical protein C1O28_13835 [Rathayibacter rathayi]MWV74581.1 hypothetical protein [Rathayibacter rathayi NCPPB 2980 = VKM Ac-1601]PPF14576.1 hypothetical protein C5C04_06365 [Rathayibacter rathayi]PPF49719.1 hypothetical protein C5C08_06615 [Rathayibacter rathayi]PPF79579.1 hypothetical protein C5C14_08150 [Rathayibacter rathayi]